MLLHLDDLIRIDYVDGDAPLAQEWADLVGAVDTQAFGALAGIGAGVIEGFEVTAGSGLAAQISAGKAIIDTANGLVYVEAERATLNVNDNAANIYIWAAAIFRPDYDWDSRTSGIVRLVATYTATAPPDALLLARGHSAGGQFFVDSDERVFCPARHAALLAERIAALEEAVGTPYAGTASLDERVAAIEARPGGGTGGYEYWGVPGAEMPKAPGDSTTIEQAIEQRVNAALSSLPAYGEASGGARVEIPEEDLVNQSKMLLQATLWMPDLPETQIMAVTIVNGIYGQGSGRDGLDYVDREHSTWLPD